MSIDKAELARQVRRVYFVERRYYEVKLSGQELGMVDDSRRVPQWDGGRDSRGAFHSPVWPKIVDNALKHGLDPIQLVKAVFNARQHGPAPLPSQITGSSALECYEQYRGLFGQDLKNKFDAFLDSARQEIWKHKQLFDVSQAELWRFVLLSPTLPGGALFRYCLACSMGQADLAKGFHQKALYEYMINPDEYDKVLGEHLPSDFKLDARGLQSQLLAV